MKSDRRHDLTENYLAKWLASFLEGIAPFKNHIYWTVIGILAVICIGLIWSNVSRSSRSKSWGEYFTAMESGKLENLEAMVNDYSSGEVAVRVRLTSGEILLTQACDEITVEKDKAREKLEKALGFFLAAKEQMGSDTLLNEQVLYDLAKTYESLAVVRTGQDDLASAVKAYEQLLAKNPTGVYSKEAEKTLKLLNSPAMSRLIGFYAAQPGQVNPVSETPQIDPTVPMPNEPFQMPEGFDEAPQDLDLDPTEPTTE